jgi:hypothetical protein
MHRNWLFVFVLLPFLAGLRAPARQSDSIQLSNPHAGQALQGLVTLSGTTKIDGFQSAELDFRYANDQQAAWFLIGEINSEVTDGPLATWDTTVLTDGDYDLRLKVNAGAGTASESIVRGVRVRNYTPIETGTPIPILTVATPVNSQPTLVVATAARFTATPLPVNPAEITRADIDASMLRGAEATLLVLVIIGCYLVIRQIGGHH